MRKLIMAVRDAKAEAFMPPMFVQAAGLGLRAFSDAINDPQHEFSRHPEDYSLYMLGEFDELQGVVHPASPGPELVVLGATVLRGDRLKVLS